MMATGMKLVNNAGTSAFDITAVTGLDIMKTDITSLKLFYYDRSSTQFWFTIIPDYKLS